MMFTFEILISENSKTYKIMFNQKLRVVFHRTDFYRALRTYSFVLCKTNKFSVCLHGEHQL